MKVKLFSSLLISLFIFAGCSSAPPQQQGTMKNSNLTQGQVQLTLKKGVTSKATVLETFGSPNITTRDGSEYEVWTYQRHATVTNSNSSGSFGTIILFSAGSDTSGFEQSSKTMTLIIKFDENDTVVDFRSRSSSF